MYVCIYERIYVTYVYNCNRRLPFTRTPCAAVSGRTAGRPERSVTVSVTLGVTQNKSIYLSMGGVKTYVFGRFRVSCVHFRWFRDLGRPSKVSNILIEVHKFCHAVTLLCHAPKSAYDNFLREIAL